MNTRTKHD